MISWNELVKCIEKLQELPNGYGSEIEFTYRGVEYGIVCYEDYCDIAVIDNARDGNHEESYKYPTLRELGKAKDFGFSVEERWEEFEEVIIQPDFDFCSFEEIYESYAKHIKRYKKE